MSVMYTLLVVFRLLEVTTGQVSGLGRYGCQPASGISVLPACDSLNTTLYSCFGSVDHPVLNQSCFCRQDVLNNVFDCESEFRLCYQNDQFDSYPQSVAKNWHDQCDDYVTYSPTTPVLSNPTTTRLTVLAGTVQPFCTDFLTTCAAWSLAEAKCWALDYDVTASSALNCACSTSLLSLASVCLYDTNITCLGTEAHLSNIPLFDICGKTYSNDQIITASTASTVVAGTTTAAVPRVSTTSTVPQTSGLSQVVSVTSSAAQSISSALPSFTGAASFRSANVGYCGASFFVVIAFMMGLSLL